jgi:hypothetical protein
MSAGCATAGWTLRWLRACILATVALFTGVTAHASAGEALPAIWILLIALGVVAVAVEPLLRGPASTRRVVSLLVSGELFIHAALTLMTQFAPRGSAAMPGMHHARGLRDALPHLASDLSGRAALMVDAHLAAMVVVGLWLAAGERALWTLFSLAVRPFADAVQSLLHAPVWALTAVVVVEEGRLAFHESSRRPLRQTPTARRVTRRGPPSGVAHPLSV